MKKFNKILQWTALITTVALLIFYFKYNHRVYDRANLAEAQHTASQPVAPENPVLQLQTQEKDDSPMEELTAEDIVVNYVHKHGKLPDYYLTKNEARKQGWNASKHNLCDVLPGRAIGGDRFYNREKQLPDMKGRQYFEADLNYHCEEGRGAERIIFSNDGLIFVTRDHYKTFIQQKIPPSSK
jgi:hypothetical protein